MKRLLPALLLIALPASAARAELTLASPFTEHMVLQAGEPLRIFGRDDPGQEVTVELNGEKAFTTADADGRWLVTLPSMEDPGPHRFSAAGSSTVSFRDVLLGDVWWCGGQSNMEWPAKKTDDADTLTNDPKDPKLRLLNLPRNAADEPADEIKASWADAEGNVAANFSAVALGFGRAVRAATDRPIGLVQCAWGGSQIAAWIPAGRLQGLVDTAAFEAARAEHEAAVADWVDGGKAGPRPPAGDARPQKGFALLHNGMVHPLGPLNVRGLLWYQGESDSREPEKYSELFPQLLAALREQFKAPELPIFAVQLPGFKQPWWPAFRATQAQLAVDPALAPSGLAVTIDTGDAGDIHPTGKAAVSDRLARLALRDVYDLDVVAEGPAPVEVAATAEQSLVEIVFDSAVTFHPVPASPETDPPFELIYADGTSVTAAVEHGASGRVELRSPDPERDARDAVAVRFGFTPFPNVAIRNAEGLPAAPFQRPID